MAATFQSDGTILIIGGQENKPMPTFSVDRSPNLLADGTYISSTFSITINGYVTIGSSGGKDQSAIQAATKAYLSQSGKQGILEIAPYGGFGGGILKFNDARLTSANMSEQSDEDNGTQYIQYSLSFEANEMADTDNPTYRLRSAGETWQLQEQSSFSYTDNISSEANKRKVYTLTHTISAEGLPTYAQGVLQKTAWAEASQWCNARISETPASDSGISTNTNQATANAEFNPWLMNKDNDASIKNLTLGDGYTATNQVRVNNADVAGGSFSVTDTWTLMYGDTLANQTIEVNIDNAVESEEVTVQVNGTVQGVNTTDVESNQSDIYANALTEYKKLFTTNGGGSPSLMLATQIGAAASTALSSFDAVGRTTGFLLDEVRSFSEQHDQVAGSISWNMSFSDMSAGGVTGAIYYKSTLSYSNDGEGKDLGFEDRMPNPISVVRYGPYIYLPSTTREKTVEANVEVRMGRKYRAGLPVVSPPDLGATAVLIAPFEVSRTENWNPKTGVYTLQIGYIYE